jgi:hypothetical protein
MEDHHGRSDGDRRVEEGGVTEDGDATEGTTMADLSAFEDTDGPEEPKPTPSKTSSRRKGLKFAQIDLARAARAAKATKDPLLIIWSLLVYLTGRSETLTTTLTNQALADYGVDRFAKYRALKRLAKAGLITVKSRGKSAAEVTLIDN